MSSSTLTRWTNVKAGFKISERLFLHGCVLTAQNSSSFPKCIWHCICTSTVAPRCLCDVAVLVELLLAIVMINASLWHISGS